MQAELRQCIYEENMKNLGKIIVLFKMCLLALRKFKSKRINSLNEIKRILLAICKPKSVENLDYFTTQPSMQREATGDLKKPTQFTYDRETQELVYFGTKIFHEAMDDVNNKTEILTMNGVEIMSDIVSFILF